jgi:hypothetical protein
MFRGLIGVTIGKCCPAVITTASLELLHRFIDMVTRLKHLIKELDYWSATLLGLAFWQLMVNQEIWRYMGFRLVSIPSVIF